MQAENLEYLQALGPQFALQYPEIAIELSPIDSRIKKRIREKMQQPNPGQQMQMAEGQATIHQKEADAGLKEAQTQKTLIEAHLAPQQAMIDGMPQQQPQEFELPPEVQIGQAMAEITDKHASAQHKQAQAFKATQDAVLAPKQMQMDLMNAEADRDVARQQARQKVTQGQR